MSFVSSHVAGQNYVASSRIHLSWRFCSASETLQRVPLLAHPFERLVVVLLILPTSRVQRVHCPPREAEGEEQHRPQLDDKRREWLAKHRAQLVKIDEAALIVGRARREEYMPTCSSAAVNGLSRRRYSNAQNEPQQRSVLLSATSWTHAVNDESGEYALDSAVMFTSTHARPTSSRSCAEETRDAPVA